MRTLYPLAVILCIGLMAAFFAGSGFNAIVGAGGGGAAGEIQENVDGVANESSVNGSLDGSTQGAGDSTIVGMVLSSAGEIGRILGLIVMMPMTLIDLGFPAWFAIPIGSVVTIIASVGFIQFVTGRTWR